MGVLGLHCLVSHDSGNIPVHGQGDERVQRLRDTSATISLSRTVPLTPSCPPVIISAHFHMCFVMFLTFSGQEDF